MSRFFLGFPPSDDIAEADFKDFISLIKGTSVISAADSDRFIEIGLTENLQIRIENVEPGAPFVSVYSTLNEGEFPAVRIPLVYDGEEATASLIEGRLHSFRQLYALSVLFNSGRQNEVVAALRDDRRTDLEALLEERERLFIASGAPGSFWITLYSKAKGAGQKFLLGASVVFREGREHLLRKVRANVEADELKNERARIENDMLRLEHGQKQLDALVNSSNAIGKIKDKEDRRLARLAYREAVAGSGGKIAGLLPPPADDDSDE